MILFPLFITIITSLKTPAESAESFFSLPSSFYLDNFKVCSESRVLYYFRNSAVVTVTSVLAIYIITPMCAYAISRNMQKICYKTIYFLYPVRNFCAVPGHYDPSGQIFGRPAFDQPVRSDPDAYFFGVFPGDLPAGELHPFCSAGFGRGCRHRRLQHLWRLLAWFCL